jgi:hypothetical protein
MRAETLPALVAALSDLTGPTLIEIDEKDASQW